MMASQATGLMAEDEAGVRAFLEDVLRISGDSGRQALPAIQAGTRRVLAKPLALDAVRQAVRAALGRCSGRPGQCARGDHGCA